MAGMVVLWFRSMVHDGVDLSLGVTFWLRLRWRWRIGSSRRSRRARTVVGGSLRLGRIAVVRDILRRSHRGCILRRRLRSQGSIPIALEKSDFRDCVLAVSCV